MGSLGFAPRACCDDSRWPSRRLSDHALGNPIDLVERGGVLPSLRKALRSCEQMVEDNSFPAAGDDLQGAFGREHGKAFGAADHDDLVVQQLGFAITAFKSGAILGPRRFGLR